MSNFLGWLQAEDVALDVRLSNKAMVLAELARLLAARHGGRVATILSALSEREKLGSTGLCHGVALPHARLPGLASPVAACLRLQRAIPFDAPDDKPVNLVLGLLLPEEGATNHLRLLAHIAELLSDGRFRDEIGRADDAAVVAQRFAKGLPS